MDIDQMYGQAVALHKQGDLAGAEAICRRILAAAPDNAKALHRLGFIVHQRKDHGEALSLMRRAVEIAPAVESYRNNLGNLLRDMGRPEEALHCYQEALRLKPGYTGCYLNLGAVYQDLNRPALAMEAYERYLAGHPDDVDALRAASLVARRLGQLDRAMKHCARILRLKPDLDWAHNEMGSLLVLGGSLDKAEECYRRALEREPRSHLAHYNLGMVLHQTRRFAEAVEHLQKALEIEPGYERAAIELAKIRLDCCEWAHRREDIERIVDFTSRHLEGPAREDIEPFALQQIPVDRELQIGAARAKSRFYEEQAEPARRGLAQEGSERTQSDSATSGQSVGDADGALCASAIAVAAPARLRIGYVSPDFRSHAVGLLVHGMFRLHDRGRFEVSCYNLSRLPADAIQQSVREGTDRFIECGSLSSMEVARTIRRDGIDILVDLAGYTNFARPDIFALRPAPVQVQYLGYLDTMASSFIDYTIADHVVVDPESAGQYSEKIVYMPRTFAVFSDSPPATRGLRRSHLGLPERGTVFCCFNGAYKIEPDVFDSWMRILAAAPGSVLWLYLSAGSLQEANLRREAERRGVDPARLVFAGWAGAAEHSARCALADLFLDTFIYNAGATGMQALRAGLPILTLYGNRFLSRMGASMLAAAGLPELVCRSPREYEEKAVDLASHPEKMKAMRGRLLADTDPPPLFDTAAFVSALERAYLRMWDNHARGAAADIDLAAETP